MNVTYQSSKSLSNASNSGIQTLMSSGALSTPTVPLFSRLPWVLSLLRSSWYSTTVDEFQSFVHWTHRADVSASQLLEQMPSPLQYPKYRNQYQEYVSIQYPEQPAPKPCKNGKPRKSCKCALCTVDDANCFLTIRLGPKTSVWEECHCRVYCNKLCCDNSVQQHYKSSTSINCRAKPELLTAYPFSLQHHVLPCVSLQFSQILLTKLRTLCTCCLFHIRDIGTCWQRLTIPFHALFHPISCPQTSILLSASVWVLNNPSCWTVFTLALCMNPSSNIAPALANSSAFSNAIGDKLLMKVTSLSQTSVRCASICSSTTDISRDLNRCRSSQFVSTSTRHWLLGRCVSIFGEAAEWRMSSAEESADGFDTTRLKTKNTNKKRTICASNEKINWTNLAGTRLARNGRRLAQSIIPSTFSLVKQLPWTSSWMEQHPPLQSFEQRWCRLTTRHGRTHPGGCQRHVSWSLLLSVAKCTMKKPTTFLRRQRKIVTSAGPPIQHPQSPTQSRKVPIRKKKKCTTDKPHASLFPCNARKRAIRGSMTFTPFC